MSQHPASIPRGAWFASALISDTQSSGMFVPLMTAHVVLEKVPFKNAFLQNRTTNRLVRNVLSLSPACTFHLS